LGTADEQAFSMSQRKMKLKLILAGAIVISFVAVAVIFFQFRRSTDKLTVPLPDNAVKSLMFLEKVHQTASKEGRVQWDLNADSAELEVGSRQMVLQSPKVRFYLEDGSQVDLTARKGILYTQSNDIIVQGNVEMKSDRYKLLTDELAYQHSRRTLQSKQPVQIIGQHINLRAESMVYELDSNRALFSGNVNGNINENFPI
jgi:LPS export ABC transporter protein LptC